MIKNWLITGDTHGRNLDRAIQIQCQYPNLKPSETAIVILGDAGFNFYLNRTDYNGKRNAINTGFTFYCVRGNHEERPENLKIPIVYDKEVEGQVYCEPEFPNIKYFIDGNEYKINGLNTLVIGGAYSVDKFYRLSGSAPGHWSGWFEDEQLTKEEMNQILVDSANKKYHMILSHTCPYSWRPVDLFIDGLDQSLVDNTMELWFNQLKENFSYDFWLFGHYHDDRIVRPGVELFFLFIENLDDIINRWQNYTPGCTFTKNIDPRFYWGK